MDCRQAQPLLALLIGQDQSEDDIEAGVLEHVARCGACQQFQRQLMVSQEALAEARVYSETPRRLWPRLAERLAELERSPQFARFNVWVPTLAAAAACLLLISVASLETRRGDYSVFPGMAWENTTTRDLFQTDPEFTAHRGELPTAADLQRWRRRQLEMNQPDMQTVKGPPAIQHW